MLNLERTVNTHLADFDLRNAAQAIVDAVGALNRELEMTKPWQLGRSEGWIPNHEPNWTPSSPSSFAAHAFWLLRLSPLFRELPSVCKSAARTNKSASRARPSLRQDRSRLKQGMPAPLAVCGQGFSGPSGCQSESLRFVAGDLARVLSTRFDLLAPIGTVSPHSVPYRWRGALPCQIPRTGLSPIGSVGFSGKTPALDKSSQDVGEWIKN